MTCWDDILQRKQSQLGRKARKKQQARKATGDVDEFGAKNSKSRLDEQKVAAGGREEEEALVVDATEERGDGDQREGGSATEAERVALEHTLEHLQV